MPVLPNRAQITYNGSDVVLSNQTNTNLVSQFTMEFSKDYVAPSVVPGGDAVYVLRIENTGQGPLYNPTITDNLGNGVLSYVDGTAKFYVNGEPVTGTATVESAASLVFSVETILAENDSLLIVYAATVGEADAETVTNTAVATANGGSATGAEVTATDTAAITVASAANVSIFKSASEDTVSYGDTLVYTFTLMNTGNEAATGVSFVDAFPGQFNVTSVSYTLDGTETPIDEADYTITAPNTLTIPAADSTFELTVPAATNEGPGVLVITVTGTISA